MYRLFCEGFKNYLKYNEGETTNRLKIAEPIKLLADIELYRAARLKNKQLYEEASNLVHEIARRQNETNAFKTFSWELWGCGFKEIKGDFPEKRIEEQLKLIKLLLNSPMYWNN